MASTFDTNQKIMMHGLRNSRAADLRNIKLQLILRRLLRRNPKRITKQTVSISAPQGSLVLQPHNVSKSVNQNISPGAGNMA